MLRLEELARWVLSIQEIPHEVEFFVWKVISDAVAAAVAGYSLKGSTAARDASIALWGNGASTIWFDGRKGSIQAAAFANSMATCVLDLDDGHRVAAGHPGASIVPAVLAAGENNSAPTARMLTAIAIGYEIGIRYAASRDIRTLDTTATGRWCGVGVAAAVGWLNGDNERTVAHAMAIAGAIAPHNMASEGTKFGNDIKEAIPFATTDGLIALTSAKAGMTGPLDSLDREGVNSSALTRGNGAKWYIETTYFKLYSCCRWIHAPIDAISKIREQMSDWDAVEEILVETFQATLRLYNQIRPPNAQAAQYSVQFCVAAAAIHGNGCLQPIQDGLLADEQVLALAAKVRVKVDQEFDKSFPSEVPGRVTLITKSKRVVVVEVRYPKGETANPLSLTEHIHKLRKLAVPEIGITRASALEKALISLLDNKDLEPLLKCLSTQRRESQRSLI